MDDDHVSVLRACVYAQSALLCALARTHPAPAALLAAFDKEANESIAIALAESIEERELDGLRAFLQQLRRQISGGGASGS